jgi:WD40 repeat protein
VQVSALAVDPVQDQVLVAYGSTIVILDVISGKEIKRCEKHTQDVTCLAFRKDGLWFASGGYNNDNIEKTQ